MTETPKEAAYRLAENFGALREGYTRGVLGNALHCYTDTAGKPIYWRIRLKHPRTGEKWIRPMHLNGNGFEMGEPTFPSGKKPLYALQHLASNRDATVWITEGEQKADALNKLGLVATTSGGATSADSTDWEPLRGRTVNIWPDNDTPGKTYAGEVAHILIGIGCKLSCVDVDRLGVGSGEDAMEWLAAHPEAASIDVEALPVIPISETTTNVPTSSFDGSPTTSIIALEIGDLLARDFPAKEPLLSPWLRKQDLAMVYAERGIGKTHFCLTLAYTVASGGKFLKWEAPKPRRVLYIDGEMPGAAIKERLAALEKSVEGRPPAGFFRIITPDVQSFALPDLATHAGQEALDSVLEDAELIVLDNLSALTRTGAENEGESWIPMATWALARRREGRAVLFVHHAGKNGAQRGSSRREDLLDISVCLKRPSDYRSEQGARFEVHFTKARGLFGDDVQSIEAMLAVDESDRVVWTTKNAEGATTERVAELKALGMTPAEIATELGVHRSTVYRALGKSDGHNGQA